MQVTRALVAGSLVSVLAACGGAAATAPATATATPTQGPAEHPEGAHAPLVHRFQNAEKWAAQFDDPGRDAWQRPQEIVAAMKITPGMTVADLGAGTGYLEPYLSRAVGPTGTVLALDVEQDMVRYLGERAKREKLANVRPALVATDDPKLSPGTVDRIVALDVWHHIDAREAYAAKLHAALKPGGKVFVVDFKMDAKHGPPPHHRLTPQQIEGELGSAAFVVEELAVSLPEQYVVQGTRW
jgi:predicted methyltransferase